MSKDKTSAEAEVEQAEQTHATVTHNGLEFTIPLSRMDWTVDAIEALEDGKAATIIRELVQPAQWAAFKATRPTGRDLAKVSNLIAVKLGFADVGESPASSD